MSQESINRNTLIPLIIDALQELLEQQGKTPNESLGAESRLIGKNAVLDSLGLVTLIVDLEQRIEAEFDAFITLADDRAMSQKNSPFLNIGSLADYIAVLIAEERAHV